MNQTTYLSRTPIDERLSFNISSAGQWLPKRPILLAALFSALAFHGGLGFYGSYANTYDAYIHIFFADHWRRSWFDHWEPRWYTGFTLTSYPPLTHQLIALLTPIVGDLRVAFVVVQTLGILLLTVGMYRFARLWVDEEAAAWAALWLVFSSALAETVHVFGQLPTIFSLALLINGLPFAARWVDQGKVADLLRAWALLAATTGAHHVTTLFGLVFITAPVLVAVLFLHFRTPLLDEPETKPHSITRQNLRPLFFLYLRRMLGALVRTSVFGIGALCLLLIVVLPYWLWSRADPISQVPIPHASRDNYVLNPNAGIVFWLVPYGMLIPAFPYIFYRGLLSRAWPLTASIALLFLLGTGGTTPLPRLLLRGAFDILTLDRFTLWAAMLMLPLAGSFVVSLAHGTLAQWWYEQFGFLTWRTAQLLLGVGLIGTVVFTVSLPRFRSFQPAPLEMTPIVNFLQKDQHWRWRFLTLGFGDQMAWLSAQTTVTQVDGNYHAARRLPEMTSTSVERLEGAKFRGIPGIGSLQQFLAVPDKYSLKYVFSNDNFYDPLLFFYGWHRVQFLENRVAVWEREDVPVLPEVLPRREIPLYQRLMFGILPLLAFMAACGAMSSGLGPLLQRLMMEMFGISPGLVAVNGAVGPWQRVWQRFDQRLWAASRLASPDPQLQPFWQAWLAQGLDKLVLLHERWRPTNLTAQRVRVIVLALVSVNALLGLLLWWQNRTATPARIVAAYYDDLDFRRFGDAYQRLDPQLRPTFEEFMLQLSVQGGLVASYSKLDGLEAAMRIEEPTYQDLQVQSRYITALSYYTATNTFTLVQNPGGAWVIKPPSVDVRTPPDQFLRQAQVAWYAQGRRRVTSATTSFADVIDRPEIAILSARLVQHAGTKFSLVGEILNKDVDPADITVSGFIYNGQGEILTWYNASDILIHKLLPLEISPFRIDFEGVAGSELTDWQNSLAFEPGAIWNYRLPADARLGSFAVMGKAVVTPHNLQRSLGAQEIKISGSGRELQVTGELINHGLHEATIPHLLLTLYNANGEVAWVDHAYLPKSIRPQRTEPFQVAITPATTVHDLRLAGELYTNSLGNDAVLAGPRPDFIPLAPAAGYRYLRISVHYFAED